MSHPLLVTLLLRGCLTVSSFHYQKALKFKPPHRAFPSMSSSMPDLVPSSPRVQQFFKRNDTFIYIEGQLFFGGREPLNFTQIGN